MKTKDNAEFLVPPDEPAGPEHVWTMEEVIADLEENTREGEILVRSGGAGFVHAGVLPDNQAFAIREAAFFDVSTDWDGNRDCDDEAEWIAGFLSRRYPTPGGFWQYDPANGTIYQPKAQDATTSDGKDPSPTVSRDDDGQITVEWPDELWMDDYARRHADEIARRTVAAFAENGLEVTEEAVRHNVTAWLDDFKSGFLGEKSHIFSPCGHNPLLFIGEPRNGKDYQTTYAV